MLYRLLRSTATLALRWYYRSIEVIGLESFPAHGPVIVAANHWNALIDALIIACAIRRPVRLTAKATLLGNPITRMVVRAVGIIPLRRSSDEAPQRSGGGGADFESRNAQSFAAILDALQAGEVVLIFPEGRSHSEPELARLKTGCARLALMARFDRGLDSVPIVPVGLTFEAKGKPGSRVVLQVGPSLTTDNEPDLSPESVTALTARIELAMRDVTLNFDSRDNADRILEVSALVAKLLDRVRPLESPDPPLASAMRVAQRLEAARKVLPSASPETLRDVSEFLRRLDAFHARLQTLEIPINDLWMAVTVSSGSWFLMRELLIATAALPVAIWGRLNHWLPLTLARWIGSSTSRNEDEPAMRTLVSGLIFVLSFYSAITAWLWWWMGPGWALGYLIALPPAASLDFWLSRRLRRAVARAKAYLTLRTDPVRRAELRAEASVIRATARRLDTLVR